MLVVVLIESQLPSHFDVTIPQGNSAEDIPALEWYRASIHDVCTAATASGGDLHIRYCNPSPEGSEGKTVPVDAEGFVRSTVADILETNDTIRIEPVSSEDPIDRMVQIRDSALRDDDHSGVCILDATVPLIDRTTIDGAAMALRRNDVVFGPTPTGSTYMRCFSEPIDRGGFDPDLQSATSSVHAQDQRVGLTQILPTIETEAGFIGTSRLLSVKQSIGYDVGQQTASLIES